MKPILLAAALAALPATAAPVCHRLDVPGSTWTQLWQVNNAGMVAAGSDIGGAIYAGGVWTQLPDPPADSGLTRADVNALGINDHGFIAGGGGTDTIPETGFILHGDTYDFFSLGTADYPFTEPRAIANDGTVTGWIHDPANSAGVAFTYNPSRGATEFWTPQLDGVDSTLNIPGAMNDAGAWVGSAWFFGVGPANNGPWGYIYQPGQTQPTLLRYNGLRTKLRGINNHGTIVGFAVLPDDANGAGVIFVGTPGNFHEIDCSGDLPDYGFGIYTESINDSGVISGGYTDNTDAQNNHGLLIYPDVFVPPYTAGVSAGQAAFFGAALNDGYRYATGAGNPNFASVKLPIGFGENVYTVIAGDRAFTLAAGEKLDFTQSGFAGGVPGFTVLGVDGAAGTDPSAFVSELTFAGSGSFTGAITPRDTAGEIADLRDRVAASVPGKSLQSKARVLAQDWAAGDVAGACDVLTGFANEVAAQSGKAFSKNVGGVLSAYAGDLREDVGCQSR